MTMMNLLLLLFTFCFAVTSAKPDFLDNEVESQCINNCPLLNRTDRGHGYACDYNCNVEQCAKGCKLWRKALGQSCQELCNGTIDRLTPKDLYCVMGCNDAITRYFLLLRTLLGKPPAPALLADSLNATSLKLEWDFPEAKDAGLICHVQWKYEELMTVTSTWQYCRNAIWDSDNNVFYVNELQPYTKYRFRIALILAHTGHHSTGEPIVSDESVIINTLPEGPPASPPQNVRATPVDSSSISISWEPGPFPHGPLLSYVLNITDTYNRTSEVKDISPDNSFVMVRDVKPLTNYTIEIRMRNKRGSGPAARVQVSTPAATSTKAMDQPKLILETEYSIFQFSHTLENPVTMYYYKSKAKLKGMGIHFQKKLLFVIDTDGFVSRMPLKENSKSKIDILRPENLDFKPLDLTVDWLNDQLYILGEMKYQISRYIIKRCDFNGSSLTVAYADLNMKPSCLQIDPVNGYLFWTIQDFNKGGLYRLDISDISNGIKHEVKIKKILNETELGAFSFEYHNFNVLIPYQRQNTIMAVTLDGKEVKNIRPNVLSPTLEKVISLAGINKKFYWTDGYEVFSEEYHEATGYYFHNAVLINDTFKKVFVDDAQSQPWPLPINPPTNLQAIFGRDIAKTRWQPPHLLGLQGKGAWQNWSYEISIRVANTDERVYYNNINNTAFTITNLKENTEYILKVLAYTSSGKSLWSSEFRGSTLNASKNPIILWSAAEGLLKSNAAGENIDTIIDRNIIHNNVHFTDITWFRDQIYLVTNNSQVHWYNMTTRQMGQLTNINSVGSIAVDWIGMKLYWSNPKKQVIIRGSLQGTEQEPLLLSVLAKELNIDSIKAYLYWSTGIKVECAHLNGFNKLEYHDVHYFSGKQVMGLTLDMEEKYVYWIVRGSEGSNLYKAHMQGYHKGTDMTVQIVSSLQKPDIQGPLCYFHKRLLWLQDGKNAAISDLSGKNIATINGKNMHNLNMIYVVDSSLYMLPDDMDPFAKVIVTPNKVDSRSIRVVGNSKSFNVTWDSVKNINYGTVFYEVQIEKHSKEKNDSLTPIFTINSTIKYWEDVTPFTPLNVTIRAFTYWATGPQIRAEIFSPSSTPSAPINLRTFVINKEHFPFGNGLVDVVVRWNHPLNPNGVLQGYKLRCWQIDHNGVEKDIFDEMITTSNRTEYILNDLNKEEVYLLEVQAFTEIGAGDVSVPIAVNTSSESPVPTLLVATNDSIFIDDIDANYSKTLMEDIMTPVEMAYLVKERSLFWINSKQDIMMYDVSKNVESKILHTNGKSLSLTLDWLERSLYYVEATEEPTSSVVYKIDLNILNEQLSSIKIFEVNSKINHIEISPFTKTLYWTETDLQSRSKLMQRSRHNFIKPFFKEHNYGIINSDDVRCNCSSFPEIGSSFSLDHSDSTRQPLIIFIDFYSQTVMSSDKNGCLCHVIAKKSLMANHFPFGHVRSDFGMLYWTSHDTLYALKRNEDKLFTKQIQVSDTIIYGQHMQPYPDKKCLSPTQHDNYTVFLISYTSTSLKLQMPSEIIYNDCANISMATVKYTIYYSKVEEGVRCIATNSCDTIITFEKSKNIINLKPFTKYLVSVAVSNYFSEKNGVVIGPPREFQTAPGVPSKPRDVSAVVLSPALVEVNWSPPEELNGIIVHYEIHWQTDSTISGVRQKGELSVNDSNARTTRLSKMSPNETYTIWVRVYSENNETSNDSDRVQIRTYPEPSLLVLVNKTAYTMKLSWDVTQYIETYTVEYATITSQEWTIVEFTQQNKGTISINVKDLKPKTHYKFRLLLLYERYEEIYIWPSDSRFTFETLGDRPSPPGIPIIQYVKPNIYKVYWEASKDNGAPIEEYKLEGKILRFYRDKRSTDRKVPFYNTAPSIEIQEDPDWETFYNGTNTSWIIGGLNEKHKYTFRVSARNSYGWSNTSEESNEFDLNEAARIAEKQNPMKLILIATGVPISICFLVVLGFSYVICSGKDKQKKLQQVVAVPRVPDVELATLRELPRRGIHNTNILYVSTQPTPEELTLLPHIRRDQITLNKFLGSGAFGEVFEGKAKGITEETTETRVAVKTLKKGASDQEKSEFLQEAQLMSHFKHEHILQLLGVCLDNDPHFIIMELMEGGDLLTYLRDSRNLTTSTPSSLTLIELLKMCVDVAKGCKYLEEMHFVHRDLACRNCLVSSYETDSRIVKIGDFGLARDIYKNDYYRKEGEGLLPVRWMAPESLVDGVFTSQSDVWAFGVLLWEIMTLGQQPYPARANLEVLHYVRRGGRLGKPMDCPEDLHKLMLKCWEFEPDKRPTFKYCLEGLDYLHRKTLRNPTTAAHEGQYISTVPELFAGISNAAYFQDENHNSSGNSWKSDAEDDSNKEKTPFLSPDNSTEEPPLKEIPKYLELIYEPETPLENDGYEIPNQMIMQTNTDTISAENKSSFTTNSSLSVVKKDNDDLLQK